MSQRDVAARLWLPALAALSLLAAPTSEAGSPNLFPTQSGERPEALGVFPFDDGLLTSTAWLSVSEYSKGVERSRTPSFPLALAALGHLLAFVFCWRSCLRPRGSWPFSSSLQRVAGPRSPPLQLA